MAPISTALILLLALCLPHPPVVSAKILRVVTINSPPFVFRDPDNPSSVKGYLIDLIQKLRHKVRFNYRLHFVRDGKFGEELSGGQWNGIIGEIMNGRADVGLAPLAITAAREKVVDFSKPFMSTGIRMLIKKPSAGTSLPFSTIQQLATADHKFETLRSGSTYEFFRNSKHGLYHEIGRLMEKRWSELPDSLGDAVEKVKKGDVVFLGESAMLKFWAGHDCDIITIGSDINTIGYGIAFAKGSPLVDTFTARLLELREKGILQQLRRKWWTNKCPKAALCVCPADISSEEVSGEEAGAPVVGAQTGDGGGGGGGEGAGERAGGAGGDGEEGQTGGEYGHYGEIDGAYGSYGDYGEYGAAVEGADGTRVAASKHNAYDDDYYGMDDQNCSTVATSANIVIFLLIIIGRLHL